MSTYAAIAAAGSAAPEDEEAQEFVTKVSRNGLVQHDNLSALKQFKISTRIKEIITNGYPVGFPREAEFLEDYLLEASAALVRRKVPDQLHFELLMTPHLYWTELVEKRGGANFAIAHITAAKEAVAEQARREQQDVVERMNAQGCAKLNLSGKTRYVHRTPCAEHPTQMIDNFSTKEDFVNWFADEKVVKVKMVAGMPVPTMTTTGDIFVNSGDHRKLAGLKFLPGKPRILEKKFLNLCSGLAVKPSSAGSCSKYIDLMGEIICNGKQDRFDYLQGWMGGIVQRPWDLHLTASAIALQSPGKGAGKGVWARQFGSLFGRHFLPIAHQDHLTGKFNAHAGVAVFTFVDETCQLHDPKALGLLNTLITEPTKMVEYKGIDAVSVGNFQRFAIATNDDDPFTIQFGDRRWNFWQVSEAWLQDKARFRAIVQQMNEGGREALLHHLQTVSLDNFDAAAIPASEEKDEQIWKGAPEFVKLLALWAMEGRLPGALVNRVDSRNKPLPPWPHIARSAELYDVIRKSGGKELAHASDTALALKLGKFGFEFHGLGDYSGRKAPPLDKLQAQLEQRYPFLKGKWRFKEWGAKEAVQLGLVG
jgi:hypothetical protein